MLNLVGLMLCMFALGVQLALDKPWWTLASAAGAAINLIIVAGMLRDG